MLRIHSFLQSIYGYIKSISKRIYRTCAVIMTGAAVVAVIAFSSSDFGGSGKNHVVAAYPSSESESECEEEEVEADKKAKVQTEAVSENSEVQPIEEKSCETQIEPVTAPVTAVNVMAGADTEDSGAESPETVNSVSEYEYDILLHIVAAEAGGCDIRGQILVANVILNRVEDDAFPDSIEGVVFQENQFSPVVYGTLWGTEVTDSVREAVDRALVGEDYSQGALFFSARSRLENESMAWFDSNLKWLFEHGGHEFYTFK